MKVIAPIAARVALATSLLLGVSTTAAAGVALNAQGVVAYEGTGGTNQLQFRVTLQQPLPVDLKFSGNTYSLTAMAGTDFTDTIVTDMVIPAGQTSVTVNVPVMTDSQAEANEYMGFQITSFAVVYEVYIANGTAYGRIMNDDGFKLVSVPGDMQAEFAQGGDSRGAVMTPDARFVAFTTNAQMWSSTNWTPPQGIYVRDNVLHTTEQVNEPLDSNTGSATSTQPSISSDGRYVAFRSDAANLVADDSNGAVDVFLRDLQGNTTTIVSKSAANGAANGNSDSPSISADGHLVLFTSSATNLVSGYSDTNGRPDLFLRNLSTGATSLVLASPAGGGGIVSAQISRDGKFAVFQSDAPIAAGETGTSVDVYRIDLASHAIVRVSVTPAGAGAAGNSYAPVVSDDGSKVAFVSTAGDLVSGLSDGNAGLDVFVRNMATGQTFMASVTPAGAAPTQPVDSVPVRPAVSGDGTRVAFASTQAAYVASDTNGLSDVFVRNLSSNTTARISNRYDGVQSSGGAVDPSLSADGTKVAFASPSPDHVPNDTYGLMDVFLTSGTGIGNHDAALSQLIVGEQNGDGPLTPQFSPSVHNYTFQTYSPFIRFSVTPFDRYSKISIAAQAVPFGTTTQDFELLPGDNLFPILVTAQDGHQELTTITITNKSIPPTYIGVYNAAVYEGNSGQKTANFTVQLSKPSATDVSFGWGTRAGTATAGVDYVESSGSNVVIPAGATSAIVSVPIIGDGVVEGDETFSIGLGPMVGAEGNGHDFADGVILNDDSPTGLPTLSIADASLLEGNSGTKPMLFTAKLSAASTGPVTFDVSVPAGSSDYQPLSLTGVTIPAGATSTSFSVNVVGDTLVEQDEGFVVDLKNVVGAVAPDPQALGRILEDDGSYPSIWVEDQAIVEGNSGTKIATFKVHLSAPQSGSVYVDVKTIDGSANAGSDYVAKSVTGLRFAPGVTSMDFTVTINSDTIDEGDEKFAIQLTNPVGALITWYQASVTITDDDKSSALPSLTIEDATVVEGTSGSRLVAFVVRSAGAVPATIVFDVATSNGSATAGSDYTAASWTNQTISGNGGLTTVYVRVNGDTTVETDESFTVNLSNVRGATIADGSATGTIKNDDAAIGAQLSIGDVSIVEGNSGTKLANFSVSLSSAAASDVSFNVATANHTAMAGTDYQGLSLTGQVIPKGQTLKTISVVINGDTAGESDEHFYVNLANVSGAIVVDASAEGTIVNDDAMPTSLLSVGDLSISEGDSGTKTANFVVSLSQATDIPVTYDIATANRTAIAGSDYVARSVTGATIPAGATSQVFAVTINGDAGVENDEQFEIQFGNVTGAIADNGGLAIGTIVNDDGSVPPVLSIGDASVVEGNSGTKLLNFPITLDRPSGQPISFNLRTAGGSATAGVDYVAVPSFQKSIPAGQVSATLSVTINGDTSNEPDEIFYVDAQQVVGASAGDNVGVGRIVNDDAPALSIGDASVSEGNAGTKVLNFTITLNKASSLPVSYDLRTVAGSAAGVDFVAVATFRQTIPAGQTSATLSVTINGDTTNEPDEAFYVDAQHISGATIADNVATGKILNDDESLPVFTIGDASVAEGNAGTKVLNFPITLSKAATAPVSYKLRTVASSASADVDYVSVASFTQTIAAGQTGATLSVTINGDTAVEGDELFYVDAQNLVGATVGDNVATGTILNDDAAGPTLSISDATVTEGNSLSRQATFTVTLSQAASTAVTYSIATADGTAVAPGDYTAKSLSSVSIAAGATSKTFNVSVKGDTVAEGNETFTVTISSVVGAALADGQGVGTITNDDGATLARYDAGGLYDDVDDGHREPRLGTGEYALLLQDAASQLCRRTGAATIVAVDDVENRAVLADLADAANLACAGKPVYAAAMAQGDSRGFLVKDAALVLAEPQLDAKSKLTTLQVQVAGQLAPLSLVLPQALPTEAKARAAQLHELGSRVQATLKSDPQARLVLIGGVTVPGLIDLTQRSLPKDAELPAERVLLSPALLEEYGAAKVRFPAVKGNESQAQVLQLGR